MASNQHHYPTTTNGPRAQRSDYKVSQRRHQCPTNANRHWGNQGLSNSHVKPSAVGRKQATPSMSQRGAPRPSPKGKRILRYTAWTWQAQISTRALLSRAIRASKSRDGSQRQIRAQAIARGTWEELKRDKSYREEPLARQKGKISFEIKDKGPLRASYEGTCEETCERGRSRNTPRLYS